MKQRAVQTMAAGEAAVGLTALLALALASGCGGEVGGSSAVDAGADAADAAAADATDAGGGDDGKADVGSGEGGETWWTCPSGDGGKAATPLPTCEAPDNGDYGCKRKWTGWSIGGLDYTCNRCLGGDPKAQGRWRAIAFDSEDPELPLKGGRKELLVVDGNTFHLHARATVDGKLQEVRVDGWYFCSDPVELASSNLGFIVTKVDPPETLGWFSPDAFTGQFLSKGATLLAFGFHAGWEKDWIGYANYCKVGTKVSGKPCLDPFE